MSKKAMTYPSKMTINLAIREQGKWRPGRVIPMFAALTVAAVLFGKFAVADRLAEVSREQHMLNLLQSQAEALQERTEGYDILLEEYGRYSVGWMTEEEKDSVDRIGILDMVEQELMAAGSVRQFTVSGNTLSAELTGITLEDTSHIVQRLYHWPIVGQVSVYTATTQLQEGERAQVSLVITLTQSAKGGEA